MNKPSTRDYKHKMTNKLLVVGHPYSNLDFIVNVMQECNINVASKLKKEGIEAQEISQILLKAHGVDTEYNQEQIEINSVWNGLAMDLMMSNLKHSKWVWADNGALPLLDYWKSLDNSLGFVLVYNSPQQTLQNMIENSELDFEEDLNEALQKWQNYNRTMLNFFYRNQDHCLLINSQQVEENSQKYLRELSKQIGINNAEMTKSIELVKPQKQSISPNNALLEYFIKQIVDENEQVKQLYMELESIGNLPSFEHRSKNYSLNKILSSYIEEQKEHRSVCTQLEDEREKVKNLQTGNELTLTQLMNAHEELEKNYTKSKKLTEQLRYISAEYEQTISELNATKTKYLEIQKEKENLKKKLELAQVNKKIPELQNGSKQEIELTTENQFLLEQLHQAQEELEKYYFEIKELKNKKTVISNEERYYGAAERVKQQLSYRLGSKMIEDSKSFGGICSLPFTLYAEIKKFRTEKKTQKKLPPLHTYADAYEAERVKKHLSYRLGQTMIETMKSPFGILKLPFAIKKAHTDYKKERQ